MSNMSNYSIGLLHEVAIKAAKAGFTPEELNSLTVDHLRKLQWLCHGSVQIAATKEHVIDCDATPTLFEEHGGASRISEHRKGGQLVWDPTKIEIWHAPCQGRQYYPDSDEIQKELRESAKTPLNANVLEYLIAHPYLIPDEWKGKMVYFWGTLYCGRMNKNELYVPVLLWSGGDLPGIGSHAVGSQAWDSDVAAVFTD